MEAERVSPMSLQTAYQGKNVVNKREEYVEEVGRRIVSLCYLGKKETRFVSEILPKG